MHSDQHRGYWRLFYGLLLLLLLLLLLPLFSSSALFCGGVQLTFLSLPLPAIINSLTTFANRRWEWENHVAAAQVLSGGSQWEGRQASSGYENLWGERRGEYHRRELGGVERAGQGALLVRWCIHCGI